MYGFHKHTRLYIDKGQQNGFAGFSFKYEKILDDAIRAMIYNAPLWEALNYWFEGADDSGSVNWARINVRQLNRTPAAVGPTNHVDKFGWYGSFTTDFLPNTQSRIVVDAASTAFGVYVTEGGPSTVAAVDTLTSWNDGSQYQTIRNRTNPRVDCIVNAGNPNAVQIVATASQDNTLYYCDMGNIAGSTTRTLWTNKTLRASAVGGSGALPGSGTLFSAVVDTDRRVGCLVGGRSFHNLGVYDQANTGLSDILNNFHTAVQAI